MNAQLGEASVANPAPGGTREELLHHTSFVPGTLQSEYRNRSSLARGGRVLSLADARRLSCVVSGIHEHCRGLLEPEGSDRWFTMDIEAKLVGQDRHVVIKQARPFNFGRVERPSDCREYSRSNSALSTETAVHSSCTVVQVLASLRAGQAILPSCRSRRISWNVKEA